MTFPGNIFILFVSALVDLTAASCSDISGAAAASGVTERSRRRVINTAKANGSVDFAGGKLDGLCFRS